MVSTRPPTFKSSSPFSNPLVIVAKAPITIGIIVTFMFHSFFNSLLLLLLLFTDFHNTVSYLSQESGWQQVSSGLQGSSQYSSWSLKCCSLDDFDSPIDFQFL